MANTQNLDLVKPLGTDYALVSVLNSNSDKIDAYAGAVNASLDGLRDGLGVLADGNTHAAITSGQFVYVKNHQTLPQGLYQATTNIAANGTLSTSNLTADPKGGLNTLSEQIVNKQDKITWESYDPTNYFEKAVYDAIQALSAEENKTVSLTAQNGYHFIAMIQRSDPMRSGLWVDIDGTIKMLFSISSGASYQRKTIG